MLGVRSMNKIDALKYLIEVERYNSINLAAEKLFISKSSVSTTIKKLEEELGVPLLDRSYKGVTLTSAGKAVATVANRILKDLDSLPIIARDIQQEIELSNLSIFLCEPVLDIFMPQYLRNFMNLSKEGRVNFVNCSNNTEIMEHIGESINHFGILMTHLDTDSLAEQYPNLTFSKIFTSKVYAIASSTSKWVDSQTKKLSISDLKTIPLVLYDSADPTIQLYEKLFGRSRVDMNVVLKTRNSNLYYQAISNDMGIGFQLKSPTGAELVSQHHLRYISIKQKNEIQMSQYLVTNASYPPEKINRLVIELAQS